MSKKEVAFLKWQVISNVAFLTTQQITDTQTVSVQFVIQCFSQLEVHGCFISQGEKRMSDNHSGMQEGDDRRGKRETIFRQSFQDRHLELTVLKLTVMLITVRGLVVNGCGVQGQCYVPSKGADNYIKANSADYIHSLNSTYILALWCQWLGNQPWQLM